MQQKSSENITDPNRVEKNQSRTMRILFVVPFVRAILIFVVFFKIILKVVVFRHMA